MRRLQPGPRWLAGKSTVIFRVLLSAACWRKRRREVICLIGHFPTTTEGPFNYRGPYDSDGLPDDRADGKRLGVIPSALPAGPYNPQQAFGPHLRHSPRRLRNHRADWRRRDGPGI